LQRSPHYVTPWRSALGRARRALAPRPALRATVARRPRSGRARPAV